MTQEYSTFTHSQISTLAEWHRYATHNIRKYRKNSACCSFFSILFSWKTSCLITLRPECHTNSLEMYLNLKLKFCAKRTPKQMRMIALTHHNFLQTKCHFTIPNVCVLCAALNANTIKVFVSLWLWCVWFEVFANFKTLLSHSPWLLNIFLSNNFNIQKLCRVSARERGRIRFREWTLYQGWMENPLDAEIVCHWNHT